MRGPSALQHEEQNKNETIHCDRQRRRCAALPLCTERDPRSSHKSAVQELPQQAHQGQRQKRRPRRPHPGRRPHRTLHQRRVLPAGRSEARTESPQKAAQSAQGDDHLRGQEHRRALQAHPPALPQRPHRRRESGGRLRPVPRAEGRVRTPTARTASSPASATGWTAAPRVWSLQPRATPPCGT